MLHTHVFTATKGAADQGGADMNLLRFKLQHIRYFALFIVDGLRRRDHMDAAIL